MEKGKKQKRYKAKIVIISLIEAVVLLCLALQIAFMYADAAECYFPDYPMKDLTEILEKSELTEQDYALIYRQTGLTKIGVDRALNRGYSGKNRIKAIQKDLFERHTVTNEWFAPFICTDRLEKHINCIYLEDGDILVTSSTHLSGWRMGHTGIVVNGASNSVLESNAYGSTSYITSGVKGNSFTDRINFLVLSPKLSDDEEENRRIKSEVAKYAAENLVGKPYDVTVGVLGAKDAINRTNCSHLVWYAYNKFGYDLDSNGGLIVTPKQIANSPLVEVVQAFGFDLQTLWR